MPASTDPLAGHPVVPDDQWHRAHAAHLEKEKALTRARDALHEQRRALPWRLIEKPYWFQSPRGPQSLGDLFMGHPQLIVKHFMFAPGWTEGCVGCSFEADHLGGALLHLPQRGVSFAAVSRAPLEEILPFQRRMGWTFHWVSSHASDFNHDFRASTPLDDTKPGTVSNKDQNAANPNGERSGFSVFYKDATGYIYHTFSAFGRGAEELIGAYVLLDMTPLGRNENGPARNLTDWVRHHDRYGPAGGARPPARAMT